MGNREQGNQPESTERRFFEGSQDERLPEMPVGDPELSGWPSPRPGVDDREGGVVVKTILARDVQEQQEKKTQC